MVLSSDAKLYLPNRVQRSEDTSNSQSHHFHLDFYDGDWLMPRVCTICTHPDRDLIDHDLVIGIANRRISAQWHLSEAAVRRHKADHLPERLQQAHKQRYTAETVDIQQQLTRLNIETWAILKESRDPANRDNDLALKTVARLEKQIELQARFQKDQELEELMRRVEALETIRS